MTALKTFDHTNCCRCGADITGQPFRPTNDFDKRICLVCIPVGLTLSFPIAHEDRAAYNSTKPGEGT